MRQFSHVCLHLEPELTMAQGAVPSWTILDMLPPRQYGRRCLCRGKPPNEAHVAPIAYIGSHSLTNCGWCVSFSERR